MVCRNDEGERSRSYVWGTSAPLCRMRGIEGVGTVQLVYAGGLLRMGSDSLLMHLWRSVRVGFTGKGESDVRLVRAGTCWPENLHGSRMGYLP